MQAVVTYSVQVPDLDDRKRLGEIIRRARRKAQYRHVKGEWQDVVGYSDRTLSGLERGEKVGPDVLIDIERVFGWPDGWCERILDGKADGPPPSASADGVRDRTNITLEAATLDELLDEIASRRRTVADGD